MVKQIEMKNHNLVDMADNIIMLPRCAWVPSSISAKIYQNRARVMESQKLLQDYHDFEWGVPLHDEKRHFEFLLLETFQAGLSWQLILQRREALRQAFSNFDPVTVAQYSEKEIKQLLQNTQIIRNRSKIEGNIHNADCFLKVQKEWGCFDNYIWHFTEGRSLHNNWQNASEIPSSNPLAEQICRDLKQYGFRLLGPITTYAYLQAIGVVNDHLQSCFRHIELTF